MRSSLPRSSLFCRRAPGSRHGAQRLLTRDKPLYTTPQLLLQPSLGTLPPLHRYADQVTVIASPPLQPASPSMGPLVLGVDAGSTTTKAILLDPTTHGIVASHYARTQGDPVAATRQCLRALADQVGNLQVQQGYTRDNIVAGLVYSIAANYLNRVKGPRFVGKKVFLQGGVALNRAVGHAFAHSVGRPVVIPPSPELLGALGGASWP